MYLCLLFIIIHVYPLKLLSSDYPKEAKCFWIGLELARNGRVGQDDLYHTIFIKEMTQFTLA